MVMRLGGLSSGMDTDTIVKQLMDAERVPVNRMKQKQQKLIWQSDMYRQWNSDLFTFRTKTLSDMKLSKMYGTFNATSSDANKLSVTTRADALAGTYKMDVKQVANTAQLRGENPTAGFTDGSQLTITMGNGKTATIDISSTDLLQDVASKITNARDSDGKTLGIQAAYDDTLKQFLITTKDTGEAASFTLTDTSAAGKDVIGKLGLTRNKTDQMSTFNLDTSLGVLSPSGSKMTFKVGSVEKTIELSATDTAADLKTKLLAAFPTELAPPTENPLGSGKWDIASATAGEKITVASTDPNVLTTLGLGSGSAVYAKGENAKFVYQDDGVVRESPINNVSLFGVNYTFKDKGTTTTTITRDFEAEIKNIKDFVGKYNEIIDKLNKSVSEPVYRSFQPLTDEEKKALSEKQIDQWEEKAKSGLLRRDSTLSSLVTTMRLHATGSVDNGSKYNSLSSIGIKSTSYKDEGKLYVNEDELRKALQDDPEAIQNMFIQSSDEKGAKKGLIHRLAEDVDNAVKQLTDKAGKTGSSYISDSTSLGKMLKDLDNRIYGAESNLIKKENAYYKKFAAMETAMNKYNSQSGWLAQQFAAK